MDPAILQNIKTRYQFEQWQGRSSLDESLFVWQAGISEDDFPDWHPGRIVRLPHLPRQLNPPQRPEVSRPSELNLPSFRPSEGETVALVDRLPRTMADEKRRAWGQQRAWAVHSIWHSPTRGPDVLLSVDLYTCNSRNAADLFTVQLLGDFEGIGMANRGDPGIGDVSFTGPREYIMVFIRANLVVMLRNAGRDLMAVDEVARQFDFRIVSKPEPRGEHPDRDMVNIQPLRSKARPGEPVPLEIGPLPSTEATIKLFSRSGQFGIEDDQGLVYRPVARGRQAIEAYVVEKAGSGRQMREFDLA